MKPLRLLFTLIVLFVLAACSTKATPETNTDATPTVAPTLDSTAVAAAVEATVSAELTRIAIENPSPTVVELPASATPDLSVPTPTATQAGPPSPTISTLALDDQAFFLADVTIPDGSDIIGGEPFTKTWRLQNIGLNTWTTDYSFVFVNGDLMDGFPIFLDEEVPPGGTVDISITMIAPLVGGVYEGFWMFADAEGTVFGTGEEANQAVVVSIFVIEPTAVPTSTATPAPSPTATSTP